jgi:hypothetical protein
LKPLVTARAAFTTPDLLGTILGGTSWAAWRTLIVAVMGESLTADELNIFTELTGREQGPPARVEELWAIVGRRGGKSRAAAALVIYLSACCDHSAALAVGERGVCLVLAQNQKQAGVVFGYIRGILKSVPALAPMIIHETADRISLSNGVDIEVRAASFRGLRGETCIAVVCDELAFWYSDDGGSLNPDSSIIAALRPSLATTSGMLIGIGSPHAKRGELWNAFRRDYGPNGDAAILVARAASRTMNPSLAQKVVDRAYERDPAAADAEFGGNFRSDLESFVSREAVDAAVFCDRLELPPIEDLTYFAFADPSGGSVDSMTMSVAHKEGDIVILDAIREIRPPFSPESVVADFSTLLRSYRLTSVHGDKYAGEWPREQFRKNGIEYLTADKPKSEIYRDFLPLLNSKQIELLDIPRLHAQLCGLERRTARGGRDNIDHAPGSHDDVINAAAGALVLAAGKKSGFDLNLYLRAFSPEGPVVPSRISRTLGLN